MVDQQEEEHLFVPSCYASESSNEHWLVESGCTNHMTYDKELFRELDRTKISKVKVGNGEFIEVRCKGIVAIESVLAVFWKFKAWVENQSGCKMQFDLFCEEAGIEHHLIAPYTSQQNGVSERKNRTLMEMTRSTSLKLAEFPILKQGKNEQWNWDDGEKDQFLEDLQPSEDNVDDPPVRGTRLLSDIYQRCNVAVTKPVGFEEAKNDQKWIEAMKEEMRMKEKNHTWELMEKPQNRKIIGVKWVFSTKLNANGSINKYKARLVVKGYAQIYGVDFSETFAPVARLDTIRLLLAIAAQKCWKIYQLDVKSAVLNGFLQEEIYVEQLEGFVMQGHEDKVYLLKKTLYGLKQAPRAWYSRIDSHLLSLGFVKSLSEFTLYVKEATDLIIVPVYVDDLLIIGSNEELVKEFKAEMLMVFEMTDLGLMSYFLGMEVKQRQHEVFICQKNKDDGADKVDEGLYRSLIGCLMYLIATRPDIMHAVSFLLRFMHCASEVHFQATKRILRYIKGTVNYGIKFTHCSDFKFHGFFDSDWGGSIDDMRSTTGFCFSFGSGMFSWCSRKQEIIAQSTAEAEYVAATAAVNQALWFRKLLTDLHMEQEESTQIFVDDPAISISNNSVFHGKTKHFKIKLYFLREAQKEGEVLLLHCKTENQVADILTKALSKARIAYIDFKDSDSFNKALELNGSELGGYTLMVEEAKRRVDNRDYTGSGRGGERSSGRFGAGRFGESGGRFGVWTGFRKNWITAQNISELHCSGAFEAVG
ncbi:LOW QUALITY PROTEIN: hypothetical protein CsSME_00024846 [Camellia sinensis var. sinensis]